MDASLAAAWLLHESNAVPETELLSVLSTSAIIVPAHWPTEVANAIRKAIRTQRLAEVEADAVLERLSLLNIIARPAIALSDLKTILRLAIDCGLSTYDAAYLRLAMQERLPLATLDIALKNAALLQRVAVLPA